jgi:hypothetical protein
MPYIKTTVDLGGSIEVEKTFSGRYGKHTKNGERLKKTSEYMAEINERNAVKKLRRKIARNFEPGDYHITFTYIGDAPDKKEAADTLTKFLRRLKSWYRRKGSDLKYIKVTEYKNKRIHHHVILNQIEGALQKIRELWSGGIYPSILYAEGGFEGLARYLIKETKKTMKDKDAPSKLRYSCSRNLIEPEKITEIIEAERWMETPVAPQGYWILKDSVVNGVSEVTGRKYQYYTMVRAKDERSLDSEKYIKPRKRKRKHKCRSE